MRRGMAVQRDRVPVRCSPFVESVGERVHVGHPLTGPHDPDVQVFRHVVIVTRSPAHPGPAGQDLAGGAGQLGGCPAGLEDGRQQPAA